MQRTFPGSVTLAGRRMLRYDIRTSEWRACQISSGTIRRFIRNYMTVTTHALSFPNQRIDRFQEYRQDHPVTAQLARPPYDRQAGPALVQRCDGQRQLAHRCE